MKPNRLIRTHVAHGKCGTRVYNAWASMVKRCTNENCRCYHNYGGRGITVSEAWRMSFPTFLIDMGEPPIDHDLDRIDNNAGYSKENCRWVIRQTNLRNTRRNRFVTYKGHTMTMSELCELTDMKQNTISSRLRRGMSIEMAVCKVQR